MKETIQAQRQLDTKNVLQGTDESIKASQTLQ